MRERGERNVGVCPVTEIVWYRVVALYTVGVCTPHLAEGGEREGGRVCEGECVEPHLWLREEGEKERERMRGRQREKEREKRRERKGAREQESESGKGRQKKREGGRGEEGGGGGGGGGGEKKRGGGGGEKKGKKKKKIKGVNPFLFGGDFVMEKMGRL